MQKVDSLIASNMDPARHLGRRAVYGLAFEMYRVGPSEGEIHEKPADFIVVGEGEGTLLVGGKLVGGKPSGPDEKRGPAIDGGQKYQLRPADVIYVPANTGAGGFPPRRKKCGSPTRGLPRRSGVPRAGILASYPAAKSEDIDAALAYAAEVVRRAPSTCPLNSPRELQGG